MNFHMIGWWLCGEQLTCSRKVTWTSESFVSSMFAWCRWKKVATPSGTTTATCETCPWHLFDAEFSAGGWCQMPTLHQFWMFFFWGMLRHNDQQCHPAPHWWSSKWGELAGCMFREYRQQAGSTLWPWRCVGKLIFHSTLGNESCY